MNTNISYKDGVVISNMMAALKKEDKSVRLKITEVIKQLTDEWPEPPEDTKKEVLFEFDNDHRLSVYRAVMSIINQKEFDQIYITWGRDICKLFKCEKQFLKSCDTDIARPKGFKLDEEFEITEDEEGVKDES